MITFSPGWRRWPRRLFSIHVYYNFISSRSIFLYLALALFLVLGAVVQDSVRSIADLTALGVDFSSIFLEPPKEARLSVPSWICSGGSRFGEVFAFGTPKSAMQAPAGDRSALGPGTAGAVLWFLP